MNEKRCIVCGKVLPAEHVSAKCSLCAIGLTPPKSISLNITRTDEHSPITDAAAGRTLSGVYCPKCEAEFNLADLKRSSCSLCGAVFTPEKMSELIRFSDLDRAQKPKDSRESGLGDKSWPEDAPLW